MNTEFISVYYNELRVLGIICIILGSLSVLFAIFFLGIIKYSFFKGMALPLLIIGALEVTFASKIVFETENNIRRVNSELLKQPSLIDSLEKVSLNQTTQFLNSFIIFGCVAFVCFLFIYLYFHKKQQLYWKGLLFGLMVQLVIILSLSIVLLNESNDYIYQLNNLII